MLDAWLHALVVALVVCDYFHLHQIFDKLSAVFHSLADMSGHQPLAGRHFAVARLLRDLKELLQCPLQGCAAMPQDNNIYVWHGNVEWQGAGLCTFWRLPLGEIANLSVRKSCKLKYLTSKNFNLLILSHIE